MPPTGSEVRVHLGVEAGGGVLRGLLVSRAASEIVVLGAAGVSDTIPRSGLVRLDVSRGRSAGRGALRGLGIGATAGALALGLLAATARHGNTTECEVACPGWSGFAVGGILGGVLGGSVGATIGAVVGSQRWEQLFP
ncbi:MAG TPA: hypothetical protein VJ997_10025 [Longimicrobiales bacterium]|nr:hypothetical protein [Longimicrobiales bacterium]